MAVRSSGSLASLLGTLLAIVDELTPKRTVDELARFASDALSDSANVQSADIRGRLEAQLHTTQQVLELMVQSGGSAEMVSLLSERISVLNQLTRPTAHSKDIFAGSLSPNMPIGAEWQPVDQHLTTTQLFTRQIRDTAGRLFTDRDDRDETIQILTRIQVHREVLNELSPLITPDNQPRIQLRMRALDAVEQALFASIQTTRSDPRPSATSASPTGGARQAPTAPDPMVDRMSGRRQEIFIE